jgi:hypothetical protein
MATKMSCFAPVMFLGQSLSIIMRQTVGSYQYETSMAPVKVIFSLVCYSGRSEKSKFFGRFAPSE